MPGYDPGGPVLYVPSMAPWIANANLALIANRVSAIRFVAPRNATIKRISFVINNPAGADDQCDVGIYSANGGTLLGSCGPQSGLLNSAGVKVVTMQTPIPLVGGTVYNTGFGTPATFGGAAGQVIGFSFGATVNAFRMFGAAAGVIENFACTPQVGTPLPASITANGGPGAQSPIMALLET